MEVILINEDLFKANSPIKEDTVVQKFIPYIGIAQTLYIERILGTALTQELQTAIKLSQESGQPLPPDTGALILMIAPPLSFYAVLQGLPFHWAAIVNKGVTLRSSENSDAVSINDIAQLRRWVKDDAMVLAQTLIDYLCRCASKYPLWRPADGCGCGDSKDTGSGTKSIVYDFGIYIPTRK